MPTEGLTLEDCSGLSSNDKISANTLVGVLKASYEGTGTEANTMRLLPWAGLVGTLSKRMTEEPAAGNVQAKTGALQEVTPCPGSVMRRAGRVLLVVESATTTSPRAPTPRAATSTPSRRASPG